MSKSIEKCKSLKNLPDCDRTKSCLWSKIKKDKKNKCNLLSTLTDPQQKKFKKQKLDRKTNSLKKNAAEKRAEAVSGKKPKIESGRKGVTGEPKKKKTPKTIRQSTLTSNESKIPVRTAKKATKKGIVKKVTVDESRKAIKRTGIKKATSKQKTKTSDRKVNKEDKQSKSRKGDGQKVAKGRKVNEENKQSKVSVKEDAARNRIDAAKIVVDNLNKYVKNLQNASKKEANAKRNDNGSRIKSVLTTAHSAAFLENAKTEAKNAQTEYDLLKLIGEMAKPKIQ
jgi:hypothetical protein